MCTSHQGLEGHRGKGQQSSAVVSRVGSRCSPHSPCSARESTGEGTATGKGRRRGTARRCGCLVPAHTSKGRPNQQRPPLLTPQRASSCSPASLPARIGISTREGARPEEPSRTSPIPSQPNTRQRHPLRHIPQPSSPFPPAPLPIPSPHPSFPP